jgi:hypothetical protein
MIFYIKFFFLTNRYAYNTKEPGRSRAAQGPHRHRPRLHALRSILARFTRQVFVSYGFGTAAVKGRVVVLTTNSRGGCGNALAFHCFAGGMRGRVL